MPPFDGCFRLKPINSATFALIPLYSNEMVTFVYHAHNAEIRSPRISCCVASFRMWRHLIRYCAQKSKSTGQAAWRKVLPRGSQNALLSFVDEWT